MFRPKKQPERPLLPIYKIFTPLLEQTHTKLQKTSKVRLMKRRETFLFHSIC